MRDFAAEDALLGNAQKVSSLLRVPEILSAMEVEFNASLVDGRTVTFTSENVSEVNPDILTWVLRMVIQVSNYGNTVVVPQGTRPAITLKWRRVGSTRAFVRTS